MRSEIYLPGICERCKQYGGVAHTPDGVLCVDCIMMGFSEIEEEDD